MNETRPDQPPTLSTEMWYKALNQQHSATKTNYYYDTMYKMSQAAIATAQAAQLAYYFVVDHNNIKRNIDSEMS